MFAFQTTFCCTVILMLAAPDALGQESTRIGGVSERNRGKSVADDVPALIDALADDDSSVQIRAANRLARLGPSAHRAVPSLTKLLKSEDPRLRRSAISALRLIGPAAKSAIPSLTQLLSSEDAQTRRFTAKALGSFGPEAKSAIPALINQLKNERRGPQARDIANAIAEIGNAAVVPNLVDLLEETSASPGRFAWARYFAIVTLGNMADEATAAIPVLTGLLETGSEPIREKAAEALKSIKNPPPPPDSPNLISEDVNALFNITHADNDTPAKTFQYFEKKYGKHQSTSAEVKTFQFLGSVDFVADVVRRNYRVPSSHGSLLIREIVVEKMSFRLPKEQKMLDEYITSIHFVLWVDHRMKMEEIVRTSIKLCGVENKVQIGKRHPLKTGRWPKSWQSTLLNADILGGRLSTMQIESQKEAAKFYGIKHVIFAAPPQREMIPYFVYIGDNQIFNPRFPRNAVQFFPRN